MELLWDVLKIIFNECEFKTQIRFRMTCKKCRNWPIYKIPIFYQKKLDDKILQRFPELEELVVTTPDVNNISSLTNLKTLQTYSHQPNFYPKTNTLKKLMFYGFLRTLFINFYTNVTTLHITNCSHIDITHIWSLTKLKHLYLFRVPLIRHNNLSTFTNLKSLHFDNGMNDDTLLVLTNLEVLDLPENSDNITERGLSKLTRLKKLYLDENIHITTECLSKLPLIYISTYNTPNIDPNFIFTTNKKLFFLFIIYYLLFIIWKKPKRSEQGAKRRRESAKRSKRATPRGRRARGACDAIFCLCSGDAE